MQHENQDDQPTMGENDLRIITVEPTSSGITSTVIDDNEHVNGSQELIEEEIEEFIKNEQVAASEGNNAPINSKYTHNYRWNLRLGICSPFLQLLCVPSRISSCHNTYDKNSK